jgi:hypothetical protein
VKGKAEVFVLAKYLNLLLDISRCFPLKKIKTEEELHVAASTDLLEASFSVACFLPALLGCALSADVHC